MPLALPTAPRRGRVARRGTGAVGRLSPRQPRARAWRGRHARNSRRCRSIAFWRALGEVAPLAGLPDRAVWRISVAPARGAALAEAIARSLDAVCLLDWGGGLVWVAVTEQGDAGAHRSAGDPRSGRAWHRACDAHPGRAGARAARWPVFEPQPAPLAALSRRIKDGFDPAHILNRGRMVEGS